MTKPARFTLYGVSEMISPSMLILTRVEAVFSSHIRSRGFIKVLSMTCYIGWTGGNIDSHSFTHAQHLYQRWSHHEARMWDRCIVLPRRALVAGADLRQCRQRADLGRHPGRNGACGAARLMDSAWRTGLPRRRDQRPLPDRSEPGVRSARTP